MPSENRYQQSASSCWMARSKDVCSMVEPEGSGQLRTKDCGREWEGDVQR